MQSLLILHPAHGLDYRSPEAVKDAFFSGKEFRTQKTGVLTTARELASDTKQNVLLKYNNLQQAVTVIIWPMHS